MPLAAILKMADKHFDSGVKYGDNAASGAADAFAAAYSLNMPNFSPFALPYYNPGLFFNQQNGYSQPFQNFSPGFPLWQSFSVTPEYMMNIAALQNIHTMAAANNNRESFYDALNKIPQTLSCGNDEKYFLSKLPANAPSTRIAYSPTQSSLYQNLSAAGADASAANRPSSSRTCASTPFAGNSVAQISCASSPCSTTAIINAPHNFNLATLAEVASSMTPEAPVRSVSSVKSPTFAINAECCASSSTANNVDAKSVKQEHRNGVKSSGSRKRHRNATSSSSIETNGSNNNNNNKAAKLSSAGRHEKSATKSRLEQQQQQIIASATMNGGYHQQLNPELLNASFLAWLVENTSSTATALKNESLNETVAMLEHSKTATKQPDKSKNDGIQEVAVDANIRSKPKRAYRRRNNQTVANADNLALSFGFSSSSDGVSNKIDSLDLVDETVNEVIRSVCSSVTTVCSKSQKRKKPRFVANQAPASSDDSVTASNNNNRSDVIRCGGVGATNSTHTVDVYSNEALDLTVKKEMRRLSQSASVNYDDFRTSQNDSHANESEFAGVGQSITENNDTGRSVRKSRRVAALDMVRVPLTKGWRRQTCIRTFSHSGIRGDVIYYAPCGKKLASSGEVVRYLQKHQDNEISRDHFSFSSKILVGEFLDIKRNEEIRSITEDDVMRILLEMQRKVSQTNSLRHISTINAIASVDTKMVHDFGSISDGVDPAIQSCVNDLIDRVSVFTKSFDSGHVVHNEYCHELHSECHELSLFRDSDDVIEPNNNKFVSDENSSSSKLDESVRSENSLPISDANLLKINKI